MTKQRPKGWAADTWRLFSTIILAFMAWAEWTGSKLLVPTTQVRCSQTSTLNWMLWWGCHTGSELTTICHWRLWKLKFQLLHAHLILTQASCTCYDTFAISICSRTIWKAGACPIGLYQFTNQNPALMRRPVISIRSPNLELLPWRGCWIALQLHATTLPQS